MLRKVYLQGEIADKFGKEFTVNCSSYSEILRCIDANRPGFKQYLIQAIDKNIGFCFDTAGKSVEQEEDLLIPLKEGDVTIASVPAGSKGMGKILIAIAIAYVAIQMGGGLQAFTGTAEGATAAESAAALAANGGVPDAMMAGGSEIAAAEVSKGMALASKVGMSIATNLAMTGIAEIMAPDPSTDQGGGDSNYLFNGANTNHTEGDPVPLLYGELRVPGRRISANVVNGRYINNNATIDSGNNMYILNHSKTEEKD